jgi:hypothetical protein
MLLQGSCHCGNITFTLDWQPDPVEVPARACTCTFCRKHAGVWTSYPKGVLKARVRDPARESIYTFGTRTADFHVCACCGAVPIVTSRIDDNVYAVVNVNVIDNVDPGLFRRASASFEGEDARARMARRTKNWIPDVEFTRGGA